MVTMSRMGFERRGPVIKGAVVDSLTSEPLPGAVVSLVVSQWQEDQISVKNFVTDNKGEFSIQEGLGRQARLEISFLGYKMRTIPIDSRYFSRDNILLGKIKMTEDSEEIDQIVVKARLEMYKIKGDTIVYFPRAVNTMEGDVAAEILRAMPGVKILDDGNITIGQDTIRRSYVNNRLIFGDDPRAALKHLDAKQISLIQAYDELDEDSLIELGEENAKKRKVINLVTFDKFDTSLTGSVSTGAGTDFNRDIDDSRRGRYLFAGEASMFTETNRINLSGGLRNVSQSISGGGDYYRNYSSSSVFGAYGGSSMGGTSGYNKEHNVQLHYQGNSPDKKHNYSGIYSYRGSNSRNRSISLKDYFPSEDYGSRYSADTTSTNNGRNSHSADVLYHLKNLEKKINASANIGFTHSYTDNRSVSSSLVTLEGQPLNRTNNDIKSLNKSNSFNLYGHFVKRFEKNSVNADISGGFSDGNSDRIRIEDDEIKGTRRYITSDGNNNSVNVRGNLGYTFNTEKAGSITLSAGSQYNKSRDYVFAIDEVTHVIDSAETRREVTNTLKNTVSLRHVYSKEDKHRLTTMIAYNNDIVMRDDLFPPEEQEDYRAVFNSLSPSFSYYWKFKPMSSMNFSTGYNQNAPGLSQLTNKLDTSNPLYLRGGNPGLKRQENLRFNLGVQHMTENRRSYTMIASLNVYYNAPISRQIFFAEETYLPEYNYTAPAGATLSTYQNGSRAMRFSTNLQRSSPIEKLKSTLTMSVNYMYSNPEEGLKDEIVRTERHTGTAHISLQTNFSKNMRGSVSSDTDYTYFRNKMGNIDHAVTERVRAELRWDIINRISFTTNYNFYFSRNSTTPENALNSHMLNASVQYRIFKDRRGILALNAYDILNNSKNYSSSLGADYISTQWRQVYSSYFMLSFEYKFNITR